jgi:SulP family sulfate permease
MSGVVASAAIVASLLVLAPVLAYVPQLALAALILSALGSLVDVSGMRTIAGIRRGDFYALLGTAVATLVLGPGPGLGVGVAVSFALFLRHYHQPHVPELGLVAEDGVFRNVRRHHTLTDPRLLVVRIDAPMSFVSARQVADHLSELLEARREVRHLVIDASAINFIDFTGVETLGNLAEQLEAAGVEVHLAEIRGPVQDVLLRAPWFRDLEGAGRLHPSVHHAVEHLPVRLE